MFGRGCFLALTALASCVLAQAPLPCVPCQNGATCNRTAYTVAYNDTYGTCMCPAGYSGVSCENGGNQSCSQPCKKLGRCVNGLCQCLPQFGGVDCSSTLCMHQAGGSGPFSTTSTNATGDCGQCAAPYNGPYCRFGACPAGRSMYSGRLMTGRNVSLSCASRDPSWAAIVQGDTQVLATCTKPDDFENSTAADGECFVEFLRRGRTSGRREELVSCQWRQCRHTIRRVDSRANPVYLNNQSSVSENGGALTLRIFLVISAVLTGSAAVIPIWKIRRVAVPVLLGTTGLILLLNVFVAAPLNERDNRQTIQEVVVEGDPEVVGELECFDATCSCNPLSRDQPNCDNLQMRLILEGLRSAKFVCRNSSDQCTFSSQELFDGSFFINLGCTVESCHTTPPVVQPVNQDVVSAGAPQNAVGAALGGTFAGLVLAAVVAFVVWQIVLTSRRGSDVSKAVVYTSKALGAYQLECRSVAYTAKNENGEALPVLSDVCATFPSGALTAILGPSGAGKTTLLDVLAGREKQYSVSGTISLDGVDIGPHSGTYGRALSYVADEDAVLPTLSCREALEFSAKLRLPYHVPAEQRALLVDRLLSVFRLNRVENTVAGGLSAGERRRLGIAVNMVSFPRVLLLDEPTSGLDSFNARVVVQTLHDTARGIVSDELPYFREAFPTAPVVAMTIHQPSADMFGQFDGVVLMSSGHVIYAGDAHAAVPFLTSHNCCAQTSDVAAADACLEVAATIAVDGLGQLAEAVRSSETAKLTPLRPLAESVVCSHVAAQCAQYPLFFEQAAVLTHRGWIHLQRKPSILALHYLISTLIALALSAMYNDRKKDVEGTLSKAGLVTFNFLWISLTNLSVLEVIASERVAFIADKHAKAYGGGVYFLTKVVLDFLLLRITPAVIASCIIYFPVAFRPDFITFGGFVGITVLFSLTMASFSMLIATVSPSFGVGALVSGFAIVLFFAFGGFVSQQGSLSAGFAWLSYVSPFYYGFEFTMVRDLHKQLCLFIPRDAKGVPTSTVLTLGCDQYLFNLGLKPANADLDAALLGIWCAAYMVAAVVSILVVSRGRR